MGWLSLVLLLFGDRHLPCRCCGLEVPTGFPVRLTLARGPTRMLLFHLEHATEGRSSGDPKNQARQRRRAEPAAPSSRGQEFYHHPAVWRAAVCGELSGAASRFWLG